uniref:Uncharacterized protein n=1 Tax=Pseudomonas phage RVTF4 TaxID=3236931 RepID=A0AB39CDC5_9VIRU
MQSLSNNVAHGQNLQILAAAVKLGADAIVRILGTEHSSSTINGVFLTEQDIQEALAARIAKHLAI